ncbi:MAG: hypothetical protein JNK28_06410 [Burkholderiaceae bacterium]|nr:hypothetical protein [Burkholderiaceae bacterium]
MKPVTPALRSTRLLDQVRERTRFSPRCPQTPESAPALGAVFHPLDTLAAA